jgi:seryl-tRNA synthetase
MLDFRYVVDNLELVEKKCAERSQKIDLGAVKALADERKRLIRESEALRCNKNAVSAEVAAIKRGGGDASALIARMQNEGDALKEMEARLAAVENELKEAMYNIPNMCSDSVPHGKDGDDNVEIKRFLSPTVFDFEPLAHWDIGEKHNILNPAEAAKITGARFTVYRGYGAMLERAVINLMLDTHVKHGYTEVFAPFMVNKESAFGVGQLPKFEDGMFAVKGTDYYLVPTAEASVTNLYRNDILELKNLPIKYCSYSACFRSEAGNAGRDTRGLIRQHQFNKVELVKFAHPSQSFDELEKLTEDAERILEILKLPYKRVALCSGDLGFSSAKTYDLEVYMPSYGRYVEISSCSNFVDFQARRANIRFRDADGKLKFAHTLNGSGLAAGRTVAAILENYQNKDGSVRVPEALKEYMRTDVIR